MAHLTATIRETSPSGATIYYDLGIITSITVTYSASVTQTPCLILGYQRGFAMDDGGVTATIKLSFERVSPLPAVDSGTDTMKWSNAYWMTQMKALLNKWQGRHQGFILDITSPDTTLFPNLQYQGFITSLPFSQSSSRLLKKDITFKVGRMGSA